MRIKIKFILYKHREYKIFDLYILKKIKNKHNNYNVYVHIMI